MSSELHSTDHCGVIATLGRDVSSEEFAAGWWRLRHRGDFSWGLVTVGRKAWHLDRIQKSSEVENPIDSLKNSRRRTSLRLGHNRYVTSGGTSLSNAQPFMLALGGHTLALAHNGNIPTECVTKLRKLLKKNLPVDASDTRIIAQLLLEKRSEHSSWEQVFGAILPLLQGSFSLLCLTDDRDLFAIRDPWGNRPLCIGKKQNTWVVASESVAFADMGAVYKREIHTGEMVHFASDGTETSVLYGKAKHKAFCLLEIIYFAKINSVLGKTTYQEEHQALGRAAGRRFLAKHITVDHVIPILNSGKQMSVGVSEVLDMPNLEAISINTQERSFIQNTPKSRKETVYRKHVIDGSLIHGKRILLCDDSLVRGTSLAALLENIRPHGPKEIHIVLGSEPLIDFCDLGIDLPSPNDLLAYQLIKERPNWDSLEESLAWITKVENRTAKFLGVESVTYLDRASVNKVLRRSDDELCRHCFGGKHPIHDQKRPTYRT